MIVNPDQEHNSRWPTASFLQDSGKLTLSLPALPRPTLEEYQKEFYLIFGSAPPPMGERRIHWITSIARDTSPIGAVKLVLGTIFPANDKKKMISGAEYQRRLAPHRSHLMGYQHAAFLEERQEKWPDFMALLAAEKRIVSIDFPGLVVKSRWGDLSFPSLVPNSDRSYWELHHWNVVSKVEIFQKNPTFCKFGWQSLVAVTGEFLQRNISA